MATPILSLTASNLERVQSVYLAKVIKRDGCWGWAGTKDPGGYPRMALRDGRNPVIRMAGHRFSYFMRHGTDPGDLCVCHRCDNPECTNPDHLFLGTKKENNQDRMKKGRKGNIKGELNGRAKLTAEDVESIRTALAAWMQPTELATLYGVARTTISGIRHGKTWLDVAVDPLA